jgi:hypothetical protein
MNGGTRQSGFLEICLGSCWVQSREPAVLFARSSRGNVGELTATGEPLSQILKTKHKFIFCGLMCPAIKRDKELDAIGAQLASINTELEALAKRQPGKLK